MLVSPFDTLAQRITEEFREAIKHEIRRYKWIEKERGRDLSWEEACNEWTLAHRENLGQFLMTGGRNNITYLVDPERPSRPYDFLPAHRCRFRPPDSVD
jgi:hypothetical protein